MNVPSLEAWANNVLPSAVWRKKSEFSLGKPLPQGPSTVSPCSLFVKWQHWSHLGGPPSDQSISKSISTSVKTVHTVPWRHCPNNHLNCLYDSPKCLWMGGKLFQTCGLAVARIKLNTLRELITFSAFTLISDSNTAEHDTRNSSHVTMLSQKTTAVGLWRTTSWSSCLASSWLHTDGRNDYTTIQITGQLQM